MSERGGPGAAAREVRPATRLAGALALPTWLLLPFNADWRWQQERTDSSWYPSLRLFRQSSLGDRRPVVTELADVLRLLSYTSASVAHAATRVLGKLQAA